MVDSVSLTDTDDAPWYRYGWPWFLLCIPLLSIALGASMLYLGMSTNNSLVVDDYYKAGKAINQRIARDVRASELGLSAVVRQSGEDVVLSLAQHAVVDGASPVWPAQVRVALVHVTQAQRDVSWRAPHVGAGRYVAQSASLPQSDRWRILIHPEPADGSDSSWRLMSTELTLHAGAAARIEALPNL